jgi:succinoglycan biosynthesis transport protein ExoP
MSDQISPLGPDRSRSKTHVLARMQRYKAMLRTKWWVLILGALVGSLIAGGMSWFDAPSYVSSGRMIVSIKLAIPEGSVYTEELSNFLGTQAALMQSGAVVNRAHARVAAQKPNLPMQNISLRVSVLPKTTIFVLSAVGGNAEYSQAFLQAAMEEYVSLKKEMRTQTSDTTVASLTEEVMRLEKELRKSDEELVAFQSTNSSLAMQDANTTAGNWLSTLNQGLATMKSEYDLLTTLTLDQNLELQKEKIAATPALASVASDKKTPVTTTGTEPSADYMKAKQEIMEKKASQKELGRYLRPRHPKMIALSEEIEHKESLLEVYKEASLDHLEMKKGSLEIQIRNREKDIREQEGKVLEIVRKNAEFQRLKANSARIQALYDKLLGTMQTLDVNKEVSQESVTIMEKASAPQADRPQMSSKLARGAAIGFGLGLVLLLILDRLDDRLTSFAELQDLFDEPVLGQIPKERAPFRARELKLLESDDQRHSFVEAYRNLRSSLLYMAEPGQRPKTLLLTSSVPNEGKSLTSANLAITMANAGSRILLVDADLRKGVLHSRFGTPGEPGFSEALSKGLNWEEAVHPTSTPNLFLLPRGATTQKSSEFFIGQVTETFLKQASAKYDYVMLDTAPVMAADDVTSLAPNIDGVVFVIRAEHTSARVARAALELLYQRQVRILGLIFNAVRPSSVDYYYYYRYKDYYKAHPSSPAKAKATEKAKD